MGARGPAPVSACSRGGGAGIPEKTSAVQIDVVFP